MEEQLAAYRARKGKEHKAASSLFPGLFKRRNIDTENKIPSVNPENSPEPTEQQTSPLEPRVSPLEESSTNVYAVDEVKTWRDYVITLLYVILWLLLWRFFIEIEFGSVYFIISVGYFMYKNTRTGPKRPNRLSAYSVFNPNQERLDGTFTTEQFEKELRFGASSVH